MKQKYSIFIPGLLVSLVIGNSSLKAQNTNPLVHPLKYSTPVPGKEKELLKDAVEDVSQRTLYSSTWKARNGRIVSHFSSVMLNYSDANGRLQPIDLTLHSDARGWVADKQPNSCYFHSDRSSAINIGGNNEITFNKNCTINGMMLDQQIVSMQNEKVKMDLSQGVEKDLTFVTDGIKTDYIFNKPLEGGISVAEEVEIPAGCSLQKDDKTGMIQPDGGWAGDYLLLSPDGKLLAKFLAAECYDAKSHWCYANYSVEKKDGKNILTTTIPQPWLTKAVYPVTLDPLVVGATSHWTGGAMQSCVYPDFHSDSILVTIPADITIYYFTIDYAYVSQTNINDQQFINNGIFYLSTPCGRTDTLSCADSPGGGDSAGICYLVPYFDFHNPMTCCYSPSCSPQSFWLAAYLSRRRGGFGCDTTSIWYSAGYYTGFQYYFSAWLEGYTDSITSLKYLPASQCSNSCTLTMDATLGFGVPPYTVSHPWSANGRDTVVGSYGACISEGTVLMNLKIPGADCPFKCLSPDTTIVVPAPTVVDACGDTVKNIPAQKVKLKPVPVISYVPIDTSVCTGSPVVVSLRSCVPGTTFNWTGSDNASGSGDTNISDNTHDSSNSPLVVTYKILGTANGCNSDTITAQGVINPYPIVNITQSDTMNIGESKKLSATGGGTYIWAPSTGLNCTTCPNPVATPTITTTYYVTVTDSEGCAVSKSVTLIVLDENITIPNVITPDDAGPMGLDNLFYIRNLQLYPNSKLVIYDRWGKQIYSSSNYQNDWNGGGQSDGVYYYLLTLANGKKYKGFFELIK